MKTAIMIVVTALSFSSAALAAGETESTAQPPAAKSEAPATAAEQAPAAQPVSKPVQRKRAKRAHPKSADLRHCLDLKTNAAIAKCAGE